MAFTGELEQLHIVDIIQLLNTTRKSGTFSVRGAKGESRIIFSNGYIVGASHLNNKVRIGTVLVKMNAIALRDLEQALEVQKKAGKNRKPLIATLIEMGKLGHEAAFAGLKKLIEITLSELINWTKGTFTLDTEAITVSPECSYPLTGMEQEISLDAQMLLMDTLRILDERERDKQAGKTGPSDEELFSDVIPPGEYGENNEKGQVITADDLGLGDLDHLERIIPDALPITEIFDPLQIHRQKIREILADFSIDEQETFVSFLGKSSASVDTRDGPQRQEGRGRALVIFSGDELIKHSVMTICKDEGVLVFTTYAEDELVRIIDQCLAIKILPVLAFDGPEPPPGTLSEEKLVELRQRITDKYSQVPTIQLVSSLDYSFILQSYHDRIRAVLPKPSKETHKDSFIKDATTFLGTFKYYINGIFHEQKAPAAADARVGRLRDRILAFRNITEPSALSIALLQYVSEIYERSITFIIRPKELAGEKAIGVYAEKNAGPTSVTSLKIPLTKPSVFREVIEKGRPFCGESSDEILTKYLHELIGEPLSPAIILLPLKSRGKTIALVYGDFGGNKAADVQPDILEILANEAGLVLENALYRKQAGNVPKK